MQILKGTLEARCIALKILTKLNFDSSIIGEIAYQGAFAKVIKVYTAKQTSTLGAHQTVAKEFTSTQEYQTFEFDDFILDLHSNAIKFVNRLSIKEDINMMAIFNDEDIYKLVNITTTIYKQRDVAKTLTHL